jgi:hypothetical protein
MRSVSCVEQGRSVGHDSVVDGVPVAAELDRYLVHRPANRAHLECGPPAAPIGHRELRWGDRRHLLGDARRLAGGLRAAQAPLVPDESAAAPEGGQVDVDDVAILHPPRRSTNNRGAGPCLDVHALAAHRPDRRCRARSRRGDRRVARTSRCRMNNWQKPRSTCTNANQSTPHRTNRDPLSESRGSYTRDPGEPLWRQTLRAGGSCVTVCSGFDDKSDDEISAI